MNAGGRPQRLLFASTGTKDPKASDVLYVEALAAPFTVNTMPEATLLAFADHGRIGADDAAPTAATAKRCWRSSRRPASTSMRWPRSCRTKAQPRSSKSWNELMAVLASKSAALGQAA